MPEFGKSGSPSWLPRETGLAWVHRPSESTFGLQRLTPKQQEPEPQEKPPPSLNSFLHKQHSLGITSEPHLSTPHPVQFSRCAISQNGEFIPRAVSQTAFLASLRASKPHGCPGQQCGLKTQTTRCRTVPQLRLELYCLRENGQERQSHSIATLTSRDRRAPRPPLTDPYCCPNFCPDPPTRSHSTLTAPASFLT